MFSGSSFLTRISLILLLLLALPCPAALNFNGTTHQVDCGSAASLDDLGPSTWMYVYRPTTLDTTFRYMWRKAAAGTNINHHDSDLEFTRTYSTTNVDTFSTGDIISANNWYVSFFVDGGAAVAPVIFHAQLGNALAEPSYGTQITPAGTLTSDAADTILIGFRDATRRFVGDIALVVVWEKALSLGEAKDHYHRAHNLLESRLFVPLGFNGTGTQDDWSGDGNTCTVTGATVAEHAPLPQPF